MHHPYADSSSNNPSPSVSSGGRRKAARNASISNASAQQQQQQFYMDPSDQHHQMYTNASQHPNDVYGGSAAIQGGGFVDPHSSQPSSIGGVIQEFDQVTGAPLHPVPAMAVMSAPTATSLSDRSAAASALVSSIVAVDNGKGGKMYKCPRPLCTKVYKNPNGLKYHLDRGACEVDHDVMEATTGISLHTDDPTALFNLQQQAQQALHSGYDAFGGPNGNGQHHPQQTAYPEIGVSSSSSVSTPAATANTSSSGGGAGAASQNLTAALMTSDESLKIVHRPYGCKVSGCGKRYQNLNGLKYHAKTAHAGMDFKNEVYVLYPF
ncbi:hypothetical protein HDU98_008767 [Podochytrium sp. JEL0797]|nr:hypothetical protein HDU98_008767 [Podochytrium sp. JEL0797]